MILFRLWALKRVFAFAAIFNSLASFAAIPEQCGSFLTGNENQAESNRPLFDGYFDKIEINEISFFIYRDNLPYFIRELHSNENQAVLETARFIASRGNTLYYLPFLLIEDQRYHGLKLDIPAFDGIEVTPQGKIASRVQIKSSSNIRNHLKETFLKIEKYSSISEWACYFNQTHSGLSTPIKEFVYSFLNLREPPTRTLLFYKLTSKKWVKDLGSSSFAKEAFELVSQHPHVELVFSLDGISVRIPTENPMRIQNLIKVFLESADGQTTKASNKSRPALPRRQSAQAHGSWVAHR